MRTALLNIVLYSEGAFNYSDLEQYPVRLITDINDAMKTKNDKQKEAMDQAKGTNRRRF